MKSRILVILCVTIILALIHRHAKQVHARQSQHKSTGHNVKQVLQPLCFGLPGIEMLITQL